MQVPPIIRQIFLPATPEDLKPKYVPGEPSRAAGIISSRRSSNAIVGGYKNAPRMSAFVDLEYGDD